MNNSSRRKAPRYYSALILCLLCISTASCGIGTRHDDTQQRFSDLFSYELQNRALAMYAMPEAERRSRGTPYHDFWSAYLSLEQQNQRVYAPVAAKYALSPDISNYTRLKASLASSVSALFPNRAVDLIKDAAISYVPQLEELRSIAPAQDRPFFDYVVDQERAQAEALTLLSSGSVSEATQRLQSFLALPLSDFNVNGESHHEE
ncbi:MAG: hypothetical protein AAGI44_00270 [Pseudomonadota bacterium]